MPSRVTEAPSGPVLLHRCADRGSATARPACLGETVAPVLIGALAGSGTGLLLWAVAMVRLGLMAWL